MDKDISTPSAIVAAARQLLIDDGYAELSIRRVADKVGISPGNLTYHFPAKADLVHAVMDAWMMNFGAQTEGYFRSDDDPKARLVALVDFLVKDAATRDTARLFKEFWVLALHDPEVEARLRFLYESAFQDIEALLREIEPTASASTVRLAGTLIGFASEASPILNHAQYGFLSTPDEISDAFVQSVLSLLSPGS